MRISVQNGKILQQDRGFLMTTNEEGNIFKSTRTVSVEYGWQMLGGEAWHQTCKYPRMGMGIQYMHILNRNELGHPFSLYGFYDGKYFSSKNFEVTNRMALGFAYGFTQYDPTASWPSNWPNDIFCTKVNAYVELGLGLAIRLHKSLFIEPGVRLTHYSNGNTREPQKGLNIPSWSVGLRSELGKIPEQYVTVPLNPTWPKHEVVAFLAMSPRQLDFIDDSTMFHETYDMSFLMANLDLGYYYSLARQFRLGLALDFFYDGTNGMKEAGLLGKPERNAVPFHDKVGLTIFAGGEKDIDRLTVVAALGYIVARTRFESSTPLLEQRLGVRYHFHRNLFAGVHVRAYNFRAAKSVELNLGMRKFL